MSSYLTPLRPRTDQPVIETTSTPRLWRSRPSAITTVMVTVIALAISILVPVAPKSAAATALTVAQAIARQDGSSQAVTGYIVGQPVSTTNVVTSNFPNNYALALADTAGERNTAKMVYVQISSGLRAEWGLQSNSDKLGDRVTVTGVLSAYFSHAGVKSTTGITGGGATATPTPTTPPTTPPTTTPPTTTPPTSTPTDVSGYYAPAAGKTGEELKTALHDIIKEQEQLSYDEVWGALQDTDEDPNNPNNVIELYTGASVPKSRHGGGVTDWNREHVWAKSHGDFGTSIGPGTDIHHLRPANVVVNSTRNNLDFDMGGNPVKNAPGCLYDSDSFEPRDADKGDVARMILYMAVRYEGGDGYPDLEPNNRVSNGSAPYIGKITVLLQWNRQDPPSASEKRRNDIIFTKYQHNRNPFIDHPEWADAIYA